MKKIIISFLLSLLPLQVAATELSDLDALRYIASHPDLIAAFSADAAKGKAHYKQWGIKEGRQITFDPNRYMASRWNSDLIIAFSGDETKATIHYIQWGFKEGRATATFSDLDALRYIASYGDLILAFGANVAAGIRHYVMWGFKELRKILFDPVPYVNNYVDLQKAFGTDKVAATTHYINWGFREGRSPTALPPQPVSAKIGDTESNPARDACELKKLRPDVASGAYWFKPNSQEPAFKTYADFDMGCWLQVRRITGTGGWFPLNDGLLGNVELNPSFSHENNSSTHWSIKFDTIFHEYKLLGNVKFLFMSGDRSTWCVLESRSGWMQPYNWGDSNANPNTWIVDSQNTGAKPGTLTNVLNRGEQNPAEPWIGCEGDFIANQNKMLYGEAGSTLHTAFKNAKGGINIYVQPWNNDSGGG